ncbi:MAG: branched-chain amino acid ABC transporter permease [Dehalococcoidia bacterium]|nr:branched-chain amino acid ABC transporter permease [Dehalococcoidia bacterium]
MPEAKIRGQRFFLAVLLVFLILVPFDWFLGEYKQLAIVIGWHTMVTVGLCLLMGYTGQVSLGQAAFFGTGMYVSAIFSKTYDVNPWAAMALGACMTATLAFMLGPIFRLRGNYLALATLAVGYIIWKLAELQSGYTGGPEGMSDVPYLSIGGFEFDSLFRQYFLVWGICLAILIIAQNIVNSRTGRALRAIHGSESAAESLGINVIGFKIKIFVLSAVFASIAGSLAAHHSGHVSPGQFNPMVSVDMVVMAVFGGLASIWGAIFGTGVLHILDDEILIHYGQWNMVISGLILILILIFMPEGLFVALKNAYQRDGIFFLPKLLWRTGKGWYAAAKGFQIGSLFNRTKGETEP